MTRFLTTALLALTTALPALAQSVSVCDWRASAAAIVEPWEEHSKTYSEGAVRVALLDTIEPAAGAYHVLVLSPPYSELGDRQCKVISFEGTMGFAGAYFDEIDAGYDPATGLMVSIPMQIYLPEEDFSNGALLRFTLNQTTGEITPRLDLGAD